MHRRHGLPLAVVQQPVEVLTRGSPLRLAAEARAEAVEKLAQASQQRTRRASGHARSVHNASHSYKPFHREAQNQPDKVVLGGPRQRE